MLPRPLHTYSFVRLLKIYIYLGFYNLQSTLRDGQRCSTAKAYLVPSENRTNLDILTNAMVTKVIYIFTLYFHIVERYRMVDF